MRTADFDFELPPDRIAQTPSPERGQSRMLVLDRKDGTLADRRITDLTDYLRPGDVLVVNDTRVVPARAFARWADTGGRIEILFVEEIRPGLWEVMIGSGRRIRPGLGFVFEVTHLAGRVESAVEGGLFRIELEHPRGYASVLEREGRMPLPPYIERGGADARAALDTERYQTLFAARPGAVAAPTAGLHFDRALLEKIEASGVGVARITLHVGPGTFKPVKAERVDDHVMDPERYEVTGAAADTINAARRGGGRVVAVGSTSARTLESVAAEDGSVQAGAGRTRLFIHPPYRFRAIDGLLTNFHLPRSTLIMMVAAFAEFPGLAEGAAVDGRTRVLDAYRRAISLGYRFYSYGDCMLML